MLGGTECFDTHEKFSFSYQMTIRQHDMTSPDLVANHLFIGMLRAQNLHWPPQQEIYSIKGLETY
jgi:hypothetical protein